MMAVMQLYSRQFDIYSSLRKFSKIKDPFAESPALPNFLFQILSRSESSLACSQVNPQNQSLHVYKTYIQKYQTQFLKELVPSKLPLLKEHTGLGHDGIVDDSV